MRFAKILLDALRRLRPTEEKRKCVECAWYRYQPKSFPINMCSKQIDREGGIGREWRLLCLLQREDSFLTSWFMNTCGKRGRFWKQRLDRVTLAEQRAWYKPEAGY